MYVEIYRSSGNTLPPGDAEEVLVGTIQLGAGEPIPQTGDIIELTLEKGDVEFHAYEVVRRTLAFQPQGVRDHGVLSLADVSILVRPCDP